MKQYLEQHLRSTAGTPADSKQTMQYFWTQTHTKPLHEVKGKQAIQPDHRASCQNTPTCFFSREHLQLSRGSIDLSIPFQEVFGSAASHWSRVLQDTKTLPHISENSLSTGISLDAESRKSNLAELRTGLTSWLWVSLSAGCPCCTTHIFPASQTVLSLSLLC